MVITSEKIEVTFEMMDKSNMIRGAKFGVPDFKGGLIWKDFIQLTDDDFDAIEQYFLNKKLCSPH